MAISDASEIIHPDWPAPKNVSAISTTRLGGISAGIYASNNLALHVSDDVSVVEQNRENLVNRCKLPKQIKWLTQTHGTVAVDASDSNCEADASYSDRAKQVCVVMTADCLPILLCDKSGEQVAAIHAGWRGLLNGVIENTLDKFQGKNSEILAWLGPAIGQSAFTVGHEVYDAFIQHRSDSKNHFQPTKNNKYLANMVGLARLRLNIAGITSIFGGKYCTYTDEKRFYSYRRDGVCGRMASLIWLDK